MRFSLELTDQDFVTLYVEIQFLEDYLFLEQYKFSYGDTASGAADRPQDDWNGMEQIVVYFACAMV